MTRNEYEKFIDTVELMCRNCCENESVCKDCPVMHTVLVIEDKTEQEQEAQDERCFRLQETMPDEPMDWKEFEEDIMGLDYNY